MKNVTRIFLAVTIGAIILVAGSLYAEAGVVRYSAKHGYHAAKKAGKVGAKVVKKAGKVVY